MRIGRLIQKNIENERIKRSIPLYWSTKSPESIVNTHSVSNASFSQGSFVLVDRVAQTNCLIHTAY